MEFTTSELVWPVALAFGFVILVFSAQRESAGRILFPALMASGIAGLVYGRTDSLNHTQWLVALSEAGGYIWFVRIRKQRVLMEEREQQQREREEEQRRNRERALRAQEEEREQQRKLARTERRLSERRDKAKRQEQKRDVETTLPSRVRTTRGGLKAVAGMASLKKLLREQVIEVYKRPDKPRQYGLSIPNGILLYGPPGCGKTFIARQLASELKYHFFEISPSDVADSYVHGSTIKIRDIFERAISKAPSVLLIDEFDALVPSRAALGGHHHKAEEVNEFLARMATCSEKGVLLILATNAPEKIDPAVLRSGRIDKKIYVGAPDQVAREEILRHHLRGRYTAPELHLEVISEVLKGYSSADLNLLVDESARLAMKASEPIGEQHLQSARNLVAPSVSAQDEAAYERFGAPAVQTETRTIGFRA
ncbi:ATP-binding protein [Occallatibacter savannae]|uniref:ATP-binding protein n=1 Tax=Occallatibacter savannae TaxID=1002691 RepID=UPI000D69E493|nr:ATP-binding protein [Occallatibacter savannae]